MDKESNLFIFITSNNWLILHFKSGATPQPHIQKSMEEERVVAEGHKSFV